MNISLPITLAKEVRKTVKKEGYASVSEFFRTLLRAWTEKKLLVELVKSKKEITSGKGKILHSLKDLR